MRSLAALRNPRPIDRPASRSNSGAASAQMWNGPYSVTASNRVMTMLSFTVMRASMPCNGVPARTSPRSWLAKS